jgi:hypothetical protein
MNGLPLCAAATAIPNSSDCARESARRKRARHRHGNRGFYLLADGMVYQDTTHPDRQMTLFGQLGIGDPREPFRLLHRSGL